MPKQTSNGKLQLNISVDARAYALLQRYAPTRRAYGTFIGNLLDAYNQRHERNELQERIERIEHQLECLHAGSER
jgi:hypothetical protein